MAARGGLANSEATKAALLDAAEELFSSQGIDSASLRAVQRIAGLAPGTLQYHFASREDLLKALLARQQAGINEKVVRLAARLLAQEQAPDALAIVKALATPYIEFVRDDPVRGPHYMKILAQLARGDNLNVRPLIGDLQSLFPELLARAYPDAKSVETRAAMLLAARALLFLLASYAADETGKRSIGRAKQINALLRFVAGGLDATLGNAARGNHRARAQTASRT